MTNVLRKPNKLMLLVLTLLVAFMLPGLAAAAADNSSSAAAGKSKGKTIQEVVEAMQPGWNLGNTLDAVGPDETAWGNPKVTREFIHQLAEQGYHSIRLPVTWDTHMAKEPGYAIDAAWMDRVQQIVDWSLDEGLYVMVNMHHDSWLWVSSMPGDHDQVLARYKAAWTQIADRFKNHSRKLVFESINEPRFADGWGNGGAENEKLLAELNTSFHQIVRASGDKNADRPLVLPTLETNGGQDRLDALSATIAGLKDPNLIATIHYYGFWPFSVNIAGYTKFEETSKKDITDTFDRAYNTLVSKGIPVILGEYGLLGFDKNTGTIEQGEKLKFFEYLLNYVEEKRITHMLWDNGQHFGRTTYKWSDADLYAMLKASWKGHSAVADTDQIFLQKGTPAQDTAVHLTLNGRTLKGLHVADGGKLHEGRDYVLNGDTLTFKAAALSKLSASGTFGVNAVVRADFDKGADWKFNVITYDTPKLNDANGTTAAYAIPTSFNGDRLATMEAVYTSGGNAGPQNWTSYKEFGYAFVPSYETNEIKLPENFFKEVNDGEVQLKFHFWSGQVVTYTITKNGTAVTGKAAQ